MTKAEILSALQNMGSESIKKTLMKHGAREPFYGVKVEDLKKIMKKVKKDYPLSLELFDTGISDAMYLAGLIADPSKMSKDDLQRWAEQAYWYMLSEYTVAGVTAESNHAMEKALEWIESDQATVATAGWSTISLYAGITPDEKLDIALFRKLADRVVKEVSTAPNRVRYTMNGFLICTGAYIVPLTEHVRKIAPLISEIKVDMGGTACKVPQVLPYLKKMEEKGYIGKKRKSARC